MNKEVYIIETYCPNCKVLCALDEKPTEDGWIKDTCWSCGFRLQDIRLKVISEYKQPKPSEDTE